jgi:hypothetical protein
MVAEYAFKLFRIILLDLSSVAVTNDTRQSKAIASRNMAELGSFVFANKLASFQV